MVRPCLLGANVAPFVTQILDSFEVIMSEIGQIKVTLFAHVNKALGTMGRHFTAPVPLAKSCTLGCLTKLFLVTYQEFRQIYFLYRKQIL